MLLIIQKTALVVVLTNERTVVGVTNQNTVLGVLLTNQRTVLLTRPPRLSAVIQTLVAIPCTCIISMKWMSSSVSLK